MQRCFTSQIDWWYKEYDQALEIMWIREQKYYKYLRPSWIPWIPNPWRIHGIQKSIKTDYLQSQTKSENQRNPRKSRTPRNPKNPRISCILSAVPEFQEFWILEEPTKISTAERIQEILGFFGFLEVLDFLGFLWFSDLVWLCK